MKTATVMHPSWKENLLRQGRLHSMCTENIEALKGCESKSDAVFLYKKTIDWALENGYPPVEFIREEFGDCECYGIFIDKEFNGELLNEHQCYVFHNCRGNITVDLNISKRIIPMLYFANGCDLSISRSGISHPNSIRVPLYIYGHNDISAEDTEDITFVRKGGAR